MKPKSILKQNNKNTLRTTDNLIHEKTGKFIKNKFIYQLPYEDQAMLKMEILYDKEGLLRVLDENSLVLIDSAAIYAIYLIIFLTLLESATISSS